jgi:hypothetical protein
MSRAAQDWRPSRQVLRMVEGIAFSAPAHDGIDRQDLRQAALIALWQQADTVAAQPDLAPRIAHLAVIDELRRHGGRRAGVQREIRQAATGVKSLDDYRTDDASPERHCAVSQAVDALRAMPAPWAERIEALLQCDELKGAAAALGVSQSRVTQYLRMLRAELAAHV